MEDAPRPYLLTNPRFALPVVSMLPPVSSQAGGGLSIQPPPVRGPPSGSSTTSNACVFRSLRRCRLSRSRCASRPRLDVGVAEHGHAFEAVEGAVRRGGVAPVQRGRVAPRCCARPQGEREGVEKGAQEAARSAAIAARR